MLLDKVAACWSSNAQEGLLRNGIGERCLQPSMCPHSTLRSAAGRQDKASHKADQAVNALKDAGGRVSDKVRCRAERMHPWRRPLNGACAMLWGALVRRVPWFFLRSAEQMRLCAAPAQASKAGESVKDSARSVRDATARGAEKNDDKVLPKAPAWPQKGFLRFATDACSSFCFAYVSADKRAVPMNCCCVILYLPFLPLKRCGIQLYV